jgi:hypothetical protein
MGLIAGGAIRQGSYLAITVLTVATSSVASAWGQAGVRPGTSAEQVSPDQGMVGAVAVVAIGMVVILGVLVKMLDLRSKRQSEAVLVEASISDAMLRDPMLCRLPVIATAHVPLWRGTPVTVEVSGRVPTDDLRQGLVRLVEREAQRLRPDARIESRIGVGTVARRAA